VSFFFFSSLFHPTQKSFFLNLFIVSVMCLLIVKNRHIFFYMSGDVNIFKKAKLFVFQGFI